MKNNLWIALFAFILLSTITANGQMYTYRDAWFDASGNVVAHNSTQATGGYGKTSYAYARIQMPSGAVSSTTSSGNAYAEAVTQKSSLGEGGQGFFSGYNEVSDYCWDTNDYTDFQDPIVVPFLQCTSPVTRGGSTGCSVGPSSGVTVANWKFQAGNQTVSRAAGNNGNLTWSGAMAVSGTVSVDATTNLGTKTLSKSVNVNNRTNFAFTAVGPTQHSNPYSAGACNISVPTSPAANNAVGYSCLDQQFFETPYLIGDNGPNQGFRYVYSASNNNNGTATTFNFIIAGYLDNSASEFAQKQCGNYNSNTNSGYIAYAQLKSNTYEHESGNITGHYATYKTTQDNPANNLGAGVEAVVGPPGQTETDFNQQVISVATSRGNAIISAAFPWPETLTTFCNSDVRYDPTCIFRGYINFPTYASCQ